MVVINSLQEHEIQAAIQLLLETWMHTYSGLLSRETIERVSSLWHSPRLLNKQIKNPDVRFFVARDQDRIVGLSTVVRRNDEGLVLVRFYVHPSCQGRGIGKALFDQSIAAFEGSRFARVEVDGRNDRARTFFLKRGFAQTGTREEDIEGTAIPMHVLEKNL